MAAGDIRSTSAAGRHDERRVVDDPAVAADDFGQPGQGPGAGLGERLVDAVAEGDGIEDRYPVAGCPKGHAGTAPVTAPPVLPNVCPLGDGARVGELVLDESAPDPARIHDKLAGVADDATEDAHVGASLTESGTGHDGASRRAY